MPVTLAEVEHIASLARLQFSEAEKEKFTRQLNDIVIYVEKLNELDTLNIEPLSQVIGMENVFREDETTPSLPQTEALQNAPAPHDSFFTVPKVIG